MQFLLLVTFASSALANGFKQPAIFARQAASSASYVSCSGESVCGGGCYNPTSYVCCSTEGSLCAIGQYCIADSSGGSACCENGQDCYSGGASTASLYSATTASTPGVTASSATSSGSSSGSSMSTNMSFVCAVSVFSKKSDKEF